MRRTGSRLAAGLTGVLLLGLLAFPAGAAAQTNGPIAQTGGMTAVLPLFGSPGLTVDVTLDAIGNITGVALTPTGVVTQTSSDPSVVRFANTDGTTTVKVRAKGDKLSISAKSAKLADFVGTGSWSADVFGTGVATVPYTIGDDGNGNPTLAIGTPTVPAGVTAVVKDPKTNTDEDEGDSASGGVVFSANGYTKTLRISIEVDRDGGAAHLRITLSGKDRQKISDSLDALVAVGNRTWSAYLCDGTTQATVTYKVNADGTVSFVSATPDSPAAVVKTSDKGFRVRFDGTKVGVAVSLHQNEDGTYTLSVKGSSGNCGGHDSNSGDSHKGDSSSSDSHTADRSGTFSGGSDGGGSHEGD